MTTMGREPDHLQAPGRDDIQDAHRGTDSHRAGPHSSALTTGEALCSPPTWEPDRQAGGRSRGSARTEKATAAREEGGEGRTRGIPNPKGRRLPSGPDGRERTHRPYLRRGETVIPCTARTAAHSCTPWAASNWHAVAGNGRRLQARLSRATTPKAWQRVNNLQKLLVRATSNPLLASRRVTQDNQGTHTAGMDGVVYDTPEARWRVLHEGLSRKGDQPHPVSRVSSPQDTGQHSPLGLPPGQDRVRQAIVPAALEPAWEARCEAHS